MMSSTVNGKWSPYNSDSATSNMTSPFDHEPTAATMNSSMTFEHLEGATGGFEEFLSLTKDTKPERERYSFYSSDNHYSHRQKFKYQQHLNLSDTNSTELKVPVLQRHMRHNHTYGALPGQQPKERKCDTMARLMKIKAIDTSRDEKKAKRLHLPFTVEDIIHSPVEKFNDMLTKYKLTEPQLQLMKDIRRRGKNKVAAQNCRKRKMEVIETLEEEVDKMRHDRDALHRQKTLIDKERDKLRDKYNVMYREVFNSLRDEHGQPYDPAEYTLQHTPDGNVFLIPKNNTMDAVTSSGGGGTRGGGARSVDKKKKHHARK